MAAVTASSMFIKWFLFGGKQRVSLRLQYGHVYTLADIEKKENGNKSKKVPKRINSSDMLDSDWT